MRKKILRVIMLTIIVLILLICGLLYIQMVSMQKTLVEGSIKAGKNIESMSEEAMRKQARELLMESSTGRANAADRDFTEFIKDICIIADSARDIYLSPERYGATELRPYDASDMGKLVVVTAYGEGVDPESTPIIDEKARISNMQGMIISVNESNESMSTNYFATESGIFLGAENVSEYNLSTDGQPLRFEARERPWYKEAKKQGKPILTGIIMDADTGKPGISCGVPVYANGIFKGVAGGGLFLDTIQDDIDSFHVGEKGYACIINAQGQTLFSGSADGELAPMTDDSEDLRNSSNKELAELVKDALSGNGDIRIVNIDDKPYYVAYAPMETVGWSYLTVLPEQEVLQPSKDLLEELDSSNREQGEFVQNSILSAVLYSLLILAVIGLAAAFASIRLADKLADPVVKLTESVREIEGDNLDFSWNIDTGDEIQQLAESFGSMTTRMKQYIKDITAITAEKERIGAELSVATHIQASMLPNVFPAFPERKEFDLYAKMDPAKEVGGDFYDFFFVDDDHLALVMADVSGKGVPAALFMVIAKTLIKNHAQAGEKVEDVFMNSNNQLCEGNGEELFVTAWLGIIDLKTGNMKFCDAGHENPYIIHEDGSVDVIKPEKKKPPLAAMEGIRYVSHEVVLKKGDCLFTYTDGVPEATNANDELYGTDRLEKVLMDNANDDPETLLTHVRENVDSFVAEAPQFDDLTMLALRLHNLSGGV
ncbi:MAG: SpoIIE family protein phosphatase [Lachnospiraceae bacterium]|nr:SpoIIE family protein phosphatase [Lachnospiraceae bacterium]